MAPTQVEAAVQAPNLRFVRQMPQLGTGHAVQQAVPQLHDEGTTLILNGDVPLIEAADAARAGRRPAAASALALLTVVLADPSGYGRIIRERRRRSADDQRIVEHKDATPGSSAASARSTPA